MPGYPGQLTPSTPSPPPNAPPVNQPITPSQPPPPPPTNLPQTPISPPAGFVPSSKADTDGGNVAPFAESWRIAIGAETIGAAAAAQAFARQRANHTGTQLASTISNFNTSVTGVAVGLTGNQTKSGTLTFASSPRSTGTPATDNDIPNRKQIELRRLPFLRPNDAFQVRMRSDYFICGTTASGDIGEWGWTSSVPITYTLGLGEGFASGRGVTIVTGATSGNTANLEKFQGMSGLERYTATTFYIVTKHPSDSGTAVTNAAVWVGHKDGATGKVLVGWDTSVSPNFLIKHQGSAGGTTETVIDTGVPVPTGQTFWPPQFAITIIGQYFNETYLGGGQNLRVIIAGATTGGSIPTLLDQTYTPPDAIYGNSFHVGVTTRAAQAKTLYFAGIEIHHGGPFSFGQH